LGHLQCWPTGVRQKLLLRLEQNGCAYHDLRAMRRSVQFDLPLRARNDLLLQQALLRGLGDGQVLLIGNNLRRHWQMAIEPRASTSDLRIYPLWTWGFRAGRNGLWVGHNSPAAGTTANIDCSTTRFTTAYAPVAPVEEIVNAKESRTRKFRCQADQYFLCSKILRKSPFVGAPNMKTSDSEDTCRNDNLLTIP